MQCNLYPTYSRHWLVRALKGPENYSELGNVEIIGQISLGSGVHGTKILVQIGENQVFKLTDVDCIQIVYLIHSLCI